MLGRDLQAESGDPGSSPLRSGSSNSSISRDDEAMDQATRCVRRFAPNGQKKMRSQSGHITACKISDANPNEMVVSWSGDHIYSFDLLRSPDARDVQSSREDSVTKGTLHPRRRRTDKAKKRKRQQERTSTSSPDSGDRHGSRRRSEESGNSEGGEDDDEDGDLAFRVRYGNGESEDIPIPTLSESVTDAPEEVIERARNAVLNDAQRLSMRIAKGLVKLRKALFSLETSVREASEESSDQADLTPYTPAFTSALAHASAYLPKMTRVMNSWSYPLNPSPQTVSIQQSLRRNRQSAWRFVQAAGTIARVLGGAGVTTPESEETDSEDATPFDYFELITPAPGENGNIDQRGQFGYDFLKAILLWVEGGRPLLSSGFRRRRDSTISRNQLRFPIPETADEDAIETVLIPYLQERAGDAPVVNVDASRFEHDSTRILFPTQQAAVTAFANAVRLSLEDLGGSAARVDQHGQGHETRESPQVQALDRSAAKRFWALKVGRGILMEVGSSVNYEFVNRAFGGLRTTIRDEETVQERSQDDADANEEEEPIRGINLVRASGTSDRRTLSPSSSSRGEVVDTSMMDVGGDGDSDREEDSFFDHESFGHGVSGAMDDSDEDTGSVTTDRKSVV